jgi:hypothetical protein
VIIFFNAKVWGGKRKVSQRKDITFLVFEIQISDNNYKNVYFLNTKEENYYPKMSKFSLGRMRRMQIQFWYCILICN